MYEYEMDPTSILEYTEWMRFCPQTDELLENCMNEFQTYSKTHLEPDQTPFCDRLPVRPRWNQD